MEGRKGSSVQWTGKVPVSLYGGRNAFKRSGNQAGLVRAYLYQAPLTTRGRGLVAVCQKRYVFIGEIVTQLPQATGGHVVYEWDSSHDVPGSNPSTTPFFLFFFSLNNCFTGIYRRTFTLVSDQGLVAKSIG